MKCETFNKNRLCLVLLICKNNFWRFITWRPRNRRQQKEQRKIKKRTVTQKSPLRKLRNQKTNQKNKIRNENEYKKRRLKSSLYFLFPQKTRSNLFCHQINILNLLILVLKRQSSRLNLYSCKYSKRVYTQHQLLALVLLKEYISTDYRDFVELIYLTSNIKDKLGLDKIPHFTTLQKFVSRIPSSLFNLVLSRTLKLFYSHGENASIIAIDVTGFTSSYVSHYYSRRTRKFRRSFLKTSILVDTSKQVILGWKIKINYTFKSHKKE
jgi:hypothetical protein